MKKHIPYTYLIGWPALNKWYYGVRYSKNCCPEDLWVSYFTSSKTVKKFVKQYGDPPVIEIRKTFNNVPKAQIWENRVLQRLKVAYSKHWLNEHDSKAFDPFTVPRGDNHWTRKNTEAALKWRNQRENWQRPSTNNASTLGDRHWTHSDTKAAQKHKERMLGKDNPNYIDHVRAQRSKNLKLNNPVNLPGVKDKISNTLKGRKHSRKICEFCGKDIADSIYTRHHGQKCKHKI